MGFSAVPHLGIFALGLFLLSISISSILPQYTWPRRLAPWLRLAAVACFGASVGGVLGAVVGTIVLLFLPWIELIFRVRGFRIPKEVSMRPKTPPTSEHFPEFREQSRQIENAGFERILDLGWENSSQKQFARLFLNTDKTDLVTLHCIEQGIVCFSFASVSREVSLLENPLRMELKTTSSPLPSGLLVLPNQELNQLTKVEDLEDLFSEHNAFVSQKKQQTNSKKKDTTISGDQEELLQKFQQNLRNQIAYNQTKGILRDAEEGQLCYSLRGLFYLYVQVLRHMFAL